MSLDRLEEYAGDTKPVDALGFVDYWSNHFEEIERLVQSGLDEHQLFRLVRAIFEAGMKAGYWDAKKPPSVG